MIIWKDPRNRYFIAVRAICTRSRFSRHTPNSIVWQFNINLTRHSIANPIANPWGYRFLPRSPLPPVLRRPGTFRTQSTSSSYRDESHWIKLTNQVRFIVCDTRYFVLEEVYKNEGKWTAKAHVVKAEFLAFREGCEGMCWPSFGYSNVAIAPGLGILRAQKQRPPLLGIRSCEEIPPDKHWICQNFRNIALRLRSLPGILGLPSQFTLFHPPLPPENKVMCLGCKIACDLVTRMSGQ